MLFRSSAYLCFPFGLGDRRTITASHRGRMETYDREEHPIIDGELYAVYRATRQSDGRVFAMKRVSPNPIGWKLGAPCFSKEQSRQYILNEAKILDLAFLRCKHLVSLEDLGGYDLDPSIIMEAPDHTLRTMIAGNPFFMSADNGRIMSAQILSAVRYLNCNKIIHGDINFDNIFIFNTNPPTFKLAGLGLAIHAETPMDLIKDCSVAELRAPEVSPRDHVFWPAQLSFNEKIDVYSFGLILYHTMTQGPIPDFTKCICATDRYERRVQWRLDPKRLSPYYSASKDFIEWVLQKDPAARPTAEQCLQHRWLTWSSASSYNHRGTNQRPHEDKPQKDQPQVDPPSADSFLTDEPMNIPLNSRSHQPTFYDLLSIASNASEADIQKAYRTAALKCHPDKNLHDPEAKERFQELQRVYDVLMDPEKRKAYDQEMMNKVC